MNGGILTNTTYSKQAVIKKEIHIPEGFDGVCLPGHTILYITCKEELPEAFDPDRDYIRVLLPGESGGEMNNTGSAMINCNQAGKPLNGFKIQKSGNGKFSTGALFATGHYVTVNVARNGDEIHIDVTKSTVKFPKNDIHTIWEYNGHIDDISFPPLIEKYQKVLHAAVDKSLCHHCRCLHFYGSILNNIRDD